MSKIKQIERDGFHSGNGPEAESEMVLDDNIWKAFGVWLNLLREDLTEDQYDTYLGKREVVIQDFCVAVWPGWVCY